MSDVLSVLKGLGLAIGGGVVALFLALLLLLAVVGGLAGFVLADEQSRRPDGDVVLSIDLRQSMPDMARPSGVPFLSGLGFVGMINRLHRAVGDEKVKGVYVRVGYTGPGSARAEELRSAFVELRAAGKFVVAHSQGFGIGPSGYRAVSVSDQIVLQPGSEFAVSGMMLETMFLGDMFGRIDVVPDLIAIGRYKNAPDTFTKSDFTDSHAEALRQLGQSIWESSLVDIASDRGLDVDRLREIFDRSPHSGVDALDAGLVDSLSWPEETLDAVLMRQQGCEDGCEELDIADYLPPELPKKAPVFALVGGEGPIVPGDDEVGGSQFASDQIAHELSEAAQDEDVQAVVFRIDSPGGSVDASEQVWRAVERVRDAGKPVVVSMGPLAASGGYYVSMGADRIVANAATLTGSIGVYGGKLAVGGGLRKLGIEPRRIIIGGDFAASGSTEVFSPDQREKVKLSLQRIYDRFVDKAAQGRRMPRARMELAARGRVWTGADAQELGLIDQTGGFVVAVDRALELSGHEVGQAVQFRRYTHPDDPISLARMIVSSSVSVVGMLPALQAIFGLMHDQGFEQGARARMIPVQMR